MVGRERSLRAPGRRSVLGGLLAAPFVLRAGPAFARPPRVATLDYVIAEQLIVLGAPPIAVTDAGEWSKWVVEPPLPAGTVDVGTGLAPNIELLAALRPDLILTTDFTAASAPALDRIAPVENFSIYSEGGSPLPKAIDAMRRMGALLGLADRAEAYLAETDRVFASLAERARPFAGEPMLLLSFLDPRHARIYARPGLQQDVLDRLGLSNAWTGEGIYWGFATVGLEQLATVGKARAIADYMPGDVRAVLERSPLWRRLPILQDNGSIPVLPPVSAFGGVPAARRLAGFIVETLEGRAS